MASYQIRRRFKGLSLLFRAAAFILAFALSLAVPSGTEAAKVKLALSQITPYGSIELTGADARWPIYIPIPKRWAIKEARLFLSYTNSSALLEERSRLVVTLNGFILGQKPLRPDLPQGTWELELPAALLPPDYNSLEIRVIQNYTYECSDPSAPELWTRLDLDRSYLEVDYDLRDIPPSLTSITEYIFDSKLPTPATAHLVVPEIEESLLRLAALAGAAAAIRYDYRPLDLTISDQLVPNQDNIFIGDRQSLARLLKKETTDLPEGHLGVMPLPDSQGPDPRYSLLVISGDSLAEVETSAKAFAVISLPWPHEAFMTASRVVPPKITRYSGKKMLKPENTYYFQELGFSTITRRGLVPGPVDLSFRLPADATSPVNESFTLSLNLAHGAGMRSESTLNILLNRTFIAAIPLSDPRGGFFQDYRLKVPTKYLKQGANTITFDPVLVPRQNEPCQFLATGNLILTIFDDSSIQLPAMDHRAILPALGLFTENGFPLSRWPDWRTTTMALTARDWDTAGAAINLAAMISQKTGVPPYRLKVALNPPETLEGDMLLVGPWKTWPEYWRKALPPTDGFSYPFHGEVPALEKLEAWWLRLFPDTAPRRSQSPQPAEIRPLKHLEAGSAIAGRVRGSWWKKYHRSGFDRRGSDPIAPGRPGFVESRPAGPSGW